LKFHGLKSSFSSRRSRWSRYARFSLRVKLNRRPHDATLGVLGKNDDEGADCAGDARQGSADGRVSHEGGQGSCETDG
jgi:hypothetical protein